MFIQRKQTVDVAIVDFFFVICIYFVRIKLVLKTLFKFKMHLISFTVVATYYKTMCAIIIFILLFSASLSISKPDLYVVLWMLVTPLCSSFLSSFVHSFF